MAASPARMPKEKAVARTKINQGADRARSGAKWRTRRMKGKVVSMKQVANIANPIQQSGSINDISIEPIVR